MTTEHRSEAVGVGDDVGVGEHLAILHQKQGEARGAGGEVLPAYVCAGCGALYKDQDRQVLIHGQAGECCPNALQKVDMRSIRVNAEKRDEAGNVVVPAGAHIVAASRID